MGKRRVMFIADELPPDCGGAGRMAAFMMEGLSRLGHRVAVITRAPAWRAEPDRVAVHRVRCPDHLYLYVPAYARRFRETDWAAQDVVVVNDCAASTAAALRLPADVLGKCVFFLHGSEPETFFGRRDWFYTLFRADRAYVRGLSAARAVVAVSRAMREKFLRISGQETLSDKIGVLYDAVESRYFRPDPGFDGRSGPQADARTGMVEVRPVPPSDSGAAAPQILISVGRIDARKGYPRMLAIFRELVARGHDFRWIVVGDGPWLGALRHRVLTERLQDRILFTGRQPKAALGGLYRSADVFWTLSDYEEAFGLVYLEANACGIPVLAWDKGGVRESVSPGSSGFLVESEAECLDILAGRRYRGIPRERILLHAARFGEDRFFTQLEGLLEDNRA